MTGEIVIIEDDRPDVVLAFVDGDGRRWLAGAWVGELQPQDHDGGPLRVEDLKDRALALNGFTIVDKRTGDPT